MIEELQGLEQANDVAVERRDDQANLTAAKAVDEHYASGMVAASRLDAAGHSHLANKVRAQLAELDDVRIATTEWMPS